MEERKKQKIYKSIISESDEMKILLSNPINVMEETPTLFGKNQPAGLMYIASCLEKEGHEVEIIDTTVENSYKKYLKRLKKFNPDAVGISCITATIFSAWDTAELVKKNTNAKVFLGGDHVTFLPGESLYCCEYVDYVIRGEGEITTVELIKNLKDDKKIKEIKGLSYREGKRIIHNPPREWISNLDSIPYPAWHLVDMYKYTSIVGKSATVFSSRGCPRGCIFCISSRKCGLKWRSRTAQDVILEMREIMERYPKLDNIILLDDNFMWDLKRVKKFCDILIKNNDNIEWYCQGRADTIIKGGLKLLKMMKKAGCRGIQIGVETPNKNHLIEINKGIEETEGADAVKLVQKAGILVRATYIFGFENETREEIEETYNFMKELDTMFIQVGIITPFPGTPLFERWKSKIKTHDWRKFTITHQLMDSEFDLEREISKVFLKYVLRPSYLLRTRKYKLNNSWTIKTIFYPLMKIITGNKYDYMYSFESNKWLKKSEQYWKNYILKKEITFESSWFYNRPKIEVTK
jgi:anaerobic magnesium-protoporphyrin IX monomethyl ester cyclase